MDLSLLIADRYWGLWDGGVRTNRRGSVHLRTGDFVNKKVWGVDGKGMRFAIVHAHVIAMFYDNKDAVADCKAILDALAWHCDGWAHRRDGTPALGNICNTSDKFKCCCVSYYWNQCFCGCHIYVLEEPAP